jgi:hypothetical protein
MRTLPQRPAATGSATDVPSVSPQRRRFLLALTAGTATTAAAAAHAVVPAAASAATERSGTSDGYRESAHVRRYYETTRL